MKVKLVMAQLDFILFYFVFIIIVSIECGILSTCNKKDFCGACLQEPGCLWCSKPKTSRNETSIYCNDILNAPSNWCETEFLVKEDPILTVIKDSPLSQIDNNIIQIRPQNVKLKIRKGVEYKINFQYQQAKNYPIDLYFLMDMSASMERYRKDLGKLGGQLAEKMKMLTSNFRLGFGSFVDKRDLPFINTSPSLNSPPGAICGGTIFFWKQFTSCNCTKCKFFYWQIINRLKNPCGKKKPCEPAYSFKNHLSLTSKAEQFTNEVNMAKKSGNVDSPEGGFDALMQAMVCSDIIGWRTEARRLIIFATDADFHIAGDGKLGGVIEPNDAKCHMKNNEYTDDLIYDYPSISQINYVANENNFNIIFAIVVEDKRIYKVYETLSKHIDNSGIGRFGMNTGHNNIVNLITENYNKIVDKITITDNSPTNIHITYNPDCTSANANSGDRNTCNNVQLGQVINFTATIRANNCWNTTQTVIIKPGGLHASLNVQLDVVCECDCEMSNHKLYEPNALDCNGHGDKQCGVCRCHEGQYGDKCQCSGFGDDGHSEESHCIINDIICSGQGECICGQCVCRGNKYGKHCQCDDTVCRWYDGEMCSGHGRCECGTCACNSGWHGAACHLCVERNMTCIAPGDTNDGDDALLCSGRGECSCGQCKCDASKHSGEWCEETLDTPEERCQNLRTCLDCLDKGMEIECEPSCSNLILKRIPTAIIENDDQDAQVCRYSSDHCTKVFTYVYIGENTYNVTGIEEVDCSDPAAIIGFLLLYIIGSILLAGIIALIIWKACTTVMDRKEYAKFENEQKKSKWHTDENPLFVNPINTFSNPTYNRRSIWKNNPK